MVWRGACVRRSKFASNQLMCTLAIYFRTFTDYPIVVAAACAGHRIALAPALVRNGRMGDGLHEQVGILKLVANNLLQLLRMHDCRVAFACRGMLPPRRSSGRKIQLLR